MLDSVETQEDLPKRKRLRSPRSLSQLMAALLFLGLLGFLCLNPLQKRREFVSIIDSMSGYRCRFTLNASWKNEGRLSDWHADVLDNEGFSPPQPNAIVRWIQQRLYPQTLKVSSAEEILLYVIEIDDPQVVQTRLRNGYPPAFGKGTMISERHFTVDGCRASEYTFVPTPETPWIHQKTFSIFTPDLKSAYMITTQDFIAEDQVDWEVDAIVRSFHVERVGKGSHPTR